VLSAILVGGCNLGDEDETECGICGKYVRQNNPEIYLLINSDSTFTHKSPEPWGVTCVLTGNWELKGDTLLLIWPGCSYRVELYIQGNTIIYNDETGSFVYTKQDEQ
jgi:hypothetical protein